MEQETEYIQLLNFDDLLRIFEFLELRDQLSVAQTCTNFYEIIVNSIWRRRFSDIRITQSPEDTTNDTPAHVLHANGQIKALSKDDYQKFFSMNVANLRKLRLADLGAQNWKYFLGHNLSRPDMVYYLTFFYPRLSDLACVNLSSIFHDGTMRHMAAHCPNVERLNVSSRNVTGQHLCNFRHLHTLTLANCGLKVCHLNELLDKSTTLQFLDLRGNRELEHVLVPTWCQSLKTIQLDEAAFLRQFVDAMHDLPERLFNIKTFKIACRRDTENQSEFDAPKYLPLLFKVGASIRHLKILGNSLKFCESLQRIQGNKAVRIFKRLEVVRFRNNRQGMQCLKTLTACRNLNAIYIYHTLHEDKDQYELTEVLQLCRNNAQLNFLSLELGNRNEEIILRFLDDFITFHKELGLSKEALTIELLKINEDCNFRNIENQSENLKNLYELRHIREKLFEFHKHSISFDFGLKFYLKSKPQQNHKNPVEEYLEISFFDEEFMYATKET